MERPNLDFLYYQTPDEYRFQLDGPDDPNHDAIVDARLEFYKYMQTCTLQELVSTLIICLKDEYPSAVSIDMSIIAGYYSGKEGQPVRDDVKAAKFNYKLLIEKEGDAPHPNQVLDNASYLFSLSITFKQSQPRLLSWIKQELKDKTLTEDVSGDITSLKMASSPIERIEIEGKTLRIFIDRNSYIDY